MKIVVGSENPGKIEAVRLGFTALFPNESLDISGITVSSDVPEQPRGDKETLQGAINRAINAKNTSPNADYTIGLEGGIEDTSSEICAFAWIVVVSKEGRIGKGKTGTFFLPTEVAKLVRSGVELGKANDMFFNVQNSKHGGGAVGILTNGVLNRPEYYAQAVMLALIPHMNQNMQFSTET